MADSARQAIRVVMLGAPGAGKGTQAERFAKAHGIPIVINTDSHRTDGFNVLPWGVYQARRAGLSKADVANTRPFSEFRKLIQR